MNKKLKKPYKTHADNIEKPGVFRALNNPVISGIILFLLTFCVFLPTLQNGFINFDDPVYVTGNLHVIHGLTWRDLKWAFCGTDGGLWLPLTWISHMADCQLYGLKPWGHHLTSIFIHAISTALVFVWLNRMTGAMWKSFFVAALFGLHPLRVESIAWVAERKDTLSVLFWFLTMLTYVEYARKSKTNSPSAKKFYALALISFVLGLMAKPMLVTLPFVLLLLDYWPLARMVNVEKEKTPARLRHLLFEKLPFFILSALMCAVTFVVQRHEHAVVPLQRISMGDRIEDALLAYTGYLGKTFWPQHLSIYYPRPDATPLSAVLLSSLALVTTSIFFVFLRKRCPYLLTGWLWFLGTLIPVIGLVQVGDQAMADRYTYIPQIGLLLCVVWGAHELFTTLKWPVTALWVPAICAITACAVLTNQQIGFWKNSETLFRHALAVTGKNIPARANLGLALDSEGRPADAIEQYKLALQERPNDPDIYCPLGVAFLHLGKINEAIISLEKAVELDPQFANAHYYLGDALLQGGRTDDAIAQYEKAVDINPSIAPARRSIGNALLQKNQPFQAIAQFQKAVELNPQDVGSYNDLGNAYFASGQVDAAISNYQKVLEIDPNSIGSRLNLATALLKTGRFNETVVQYQKIFSLQPSDPKTRFNLAVRCNDLAWILAVSPDAANRNGTNAVALALDANQLTGYKDPRALGTLAAAYAEAGRFTDAAETAQHALSLASAQKNAPLIHFLEIQIKLYQSAQPFRDETLAGDSMPSK